MRESACSGSGTPAVTRVEARPAVVGAVVVDVEVVPHDVDVAGRVATRESLHEGHEIIRCTPCPHLTENLPGVRVNAASSVRVPRRMYS